MVTKRFILWMGLLQVLSIASLLLAFIVPLSYSVSDKDYAAFFSKHGYNPKPVVKYIETTNKAWQQGRRDILDWGCGSGKLSEELMKKGATSLIAIDLHPSCVQTTTKRLRDFSNAIALQAPSTKDGEEVPGWIDYKNEFDLVISYNGALSPLSMDWERIDSLTTLRCVVEACREGGSVIIAQHDLFGKILLRPILFLLTVLSFLFPRMIWKVETWIWSIALYFGLNPDPLGMVSGLLVSFGARNIANSILTKTFFKSSTMLYSVALAVAFLLPPYAIQRTQETTSAMMQYSGLVDVKVTRVSSIFPFGFTLEPTLWLSNLKLFPGSLVIYEGVKPEEPRSPPPRQPPPQQPPVDGGRWVSTRTLSGRKRRHSKLSLEDQVIEKLSAVED